MFKGIVCALLLPLLVACGGGGGGPGGTSDDRESEDVDPYLGSWERPCVQVDDPFLLGFFEETGELEWYSVGYWTEELTIMDGIIALSWEFSEDDRCEGGTPFAPFLSLLGLDNQGGEILERKESLSKAGWPVVMYQAESGFPVPFFNFHNVDDRLYKAEITGDLAGGLSGDEVTVNFNKYYTRVTP